jgi:hypothetical protein
MTMTASDRESGAPGVGRRIAVIAGGAGGLGVAIA